MAANKEVVQVIFQAIDRASGTLKVLDTRFAKLQKSANILAGAGGLVAVTASLVALGREAFNLGQEVAGIERLQKSFADLAIGAGISSDTLITALRAASHGTISDVELIAAANKAVLLQVADSTDDMVALMNVAIARGRAMGLSASVAFDTLVSGIGRMSPLMLDNLGIITQANKTYSEYAHSIGKSVDSLDAAERKQALLNRVIKESTSLTNDLTASFNDDAASFENLSASAANAKLALGKLFTPFAARIAQSYANDLRIITEQLNALSNTAPKVDQLQEVLFAQGKAVTALADKMQEVAKMPPVPEGMFTAGFQDLESLRFELKRAGEDYNATAAAMGTPLLDTEALSQGIVQFTDASQRTALVLAELSGSTDSTVVAVQHFAIMAANAAPNVDALKNAIHSLITEQRGLLSITEHAESALRASFKSVVENMGVSGAVKGFEAATQEVQATVEALHEQGAQQDQIDFTVASIVQKYQAGNRELLKTKEAVAEVDKAFEDLKSKVESVLTAALDPGVGVDPNDFLPRPDAINEDARRLADVVVKGYDSPWADYLNNKFPQLFDGAFEGGNVKEKAAQVLRDFQDGLHPELIDKDAAKERVKKMLVGDANMKQLADEIASEIYQEQGGNKADIQAAVNTQLGTTDQGALGRTSGDAFSTGMRNAILNSNVGSAIVEIIANQTANKAVLLKVSGAANGKTWGDAFLSTVREGVPVALIHILVGLVLPEILAKLQAEKSKAGTVD